MQSSCWLAPLFSLPAGTPCSDTQHSDSGCSQRPGGTHGPHLRDPLGSLVGLGGSLVGAAQVTGVPRAHSLQEALELVHIHVLLQVQGHLPGRPAVSSQAVKMYDPCIGCMRCIQACPPWGCCIEVLQLGVLRPAAGAPAGQDSSQLVSCGKCVPRLLACAATLMLLTRWGCAEVPHLPGSCMYTTL